MPLQNATVKKLMREHFTDGTPLCVTAEEQKAFATHINPRIDSLNQVEVTSNYYISNLEKGRFITAFTIEDPTADRYYYRSGETFRLVTNEQDELQITNSYESILISNIEELFSFIAACQERLNRQLALKTRRQKVRDLKAQAIIARVKKLAKEEKFDFATDTDTQKLKLYVRLSQNECIELHIPFKHFEEMLPHLRSAILSLRELYEKGIRFKPRSTTKIGWRTQWVSHESL
ncbi:hypothetical protein KFU94_55600 [Chloroflexi bacterium TSY]|nr:hypothetical protein [Chloroflexi bacterium TSY]